MEIINETVREDFQEPLQTVKSTRRVRRHESTRSLKGRSKMKKKETEPLSSPKVVEKKKVAFD